MPMTKERLWHRGRIDSAFPKITLRSQGLCNIRRGQKKKKKIYDHVPFAGPKYPVFGKSSHGTPCPSAVFTYTVFPHQSGNTAPGYDTQKKMIIPLIAMPVSSAAART